MTRQSGSPVTAALCSWAVATLALTVLATTAAAGALTSQGPVLLAGFATKNGVDLFLPGIGWRLQASAGEWLRATGNRVGIEPSFIIEPAVAAITGDTDSFEAQVVPMLHIERRRDIQENRLTPYAEAGIGLAYTAVQGLRLGSEILFSDQIGFGLTLPRWGNRRVGIGYRFRHQSHAGLWANTNSGLNTHFLVFTVQ